jgi:AcrR family transcriptional regulator
MKSTTTIDPCRRDRILDAAEETFAEFGFAGASLRHMVQEANVNLATVYYYFGSKGGLMEAVLKRRFGPLREEHLGLLRQFQQAAPGRALPVEQILEAMLLPPLRLAATESTRRQAVTRLIGRIVTEPDPQTQEILRRQRAPVRGAFLEALTASLPGVSPTILRWRMELVWGALAFILVHPQRLAAETPGTGVPLDVGRVLAEMIRFFLPGFRAPAADLDEPIGRNGPLRPATASPRKRAIMQRKERPLAGGRLETKKPARRPRPEISQPGLNP